MDYTFIQSTNPGNKTRNSGVWAKKLQIISENKVKGINYTVKVIAREKNCVGKLQREWKELGPQTENEKNEVYQLKSRGARNLRSIKTL